MVFNLPRGALCTHTRRGKVRFARRVKWEGMWTNPLLKQRMACSLLLNPGKCALNPLFLSLSLSLPRRPFSAARRRVVAAQRIRRRARRRSPEGDGMASTSAASTTSPLRRKDAGGGFKGYEDEEAALRPLEPDRAEIEMPSSDRGISEFFLCCDPLDSDSIVSLPSRSVTIWKCPLFWTSSFPCFKSWYFKIGIFFLFAR